MIVFQATGQVCGNEQKDLRFGITEPKFCDIQHLTS